METMLEIKECNNAACNCQATEDEYCGKFCAEVEGEASSPGCGCGHSCCDRLNLAFENQSVPVTLR